MDGGGGGAGGRVGQLCEFSGAGNEFANGSFNVEYHLPLAEEGPLDALGWGDGRMGEAALGKVRAQTARNAASMEHLSKTTYRAAGTKVRGEAPDVAKSVGRDGGFAMWR